MNGYSPQRGDNTQGVMNCETRGFCSQEDCMYILAGYQYRRYDNTDKGRIWNVSKCSGYVSKTHDSFICGQAWFT